MKNGKKTTKKNTETTTAETSELDSASIETGAENTNAETQPIETANTEVYAVMEGTENIAVMDLQTVMNQLGENFSSKEIEDMQNGKRLLSFGGFSYTATEESARQIIKANGWADENIQNDDVELTYDFDEPKEVTDSETIEDVLGIEKVDEIIDDPNQPIYDLFQSNANFAATLNKKETSLIERLISGKVVVASLTDTTRALLDSIVSKYWDYKSKSEDNDAKAAINDEQEPIENFRRSESLEKSETTVEIEIVEDEPDTPLNDEETAELAERETAIVQAKEQFENSTQIMADNLYEIRHKNLFRDSGKNFEDYASERFGIAKKYAHLLAQRGSFRNVLSEIGEQPLQLAMSANSTEQWAQDTNKIAKQLGVKTSDYDVMKPIIEAVSGVIAESATDANGELTSVAPRIFSAANYMIPEIIKSGMIEVNGEQMKIEDVLGLGEEILTESLKTQIIENVAEGIKTQKQNIIDYIKDVKSNRTKPHEPAPMPKVVDSKKVFKGLVPSYSVICSVHKIDDNYIVNVFNAGFGLKCGCKWQLLQGYEGFQCIETDNKVVAYD